MSNNTKQFGTSGVWRGWVELGGDVNWETYGGKWARKDPKNSQVIYVIEHTDMVEACGERDAEGHDQFVDSVSMINLAEVSESDMQSAFDCCCIDLDEYDGTEIDLDLVRAEALSSYGVAAPMGEYSDPSYPERARAAARRAVEEMLADSDQVEALLDRPVNAIGSTARDFGRGDCMAGLDRYKRAKEAASLSVNFGAVPSDDPIAYTCGYQHGATGQPLADAEDDELAQAYLDGHALGVKVLAGEVEPPPWAKPAPSNPAMDLMAKLHG